MASGTDALDQAEQLELEAARIYSDLAVRSGIDPAWAARFERLAREESEHASRLRMLKSMYLKERRSTIRVALPQVRSLLDEARRIRAEVGRSPPAPLAELVPLLVELEQRFGAAHAEALASAAPEGVRELFELLARQDREHQRLLSERP